MEKQLLSMLPLLFSYSLFSGSCFLSSSQSSPPSALICSHFPISFYPPRSVAVITSSVCLTIPPTTSTSLSCPLHIFSITCPFSSSHIPISVFRSLLLNLIFSFQSSPSSSPSFTIAVSPCSSRISYFQSQIAVAGMPNRTRENRGSALTGCHLQT